MADYQKDLAKLANGEKVSHDLAAEELTANAIGDALADPAFLQRMAQRNPSKFADLARKFIAYLNRVLDKVRGLGSEKYLSDVETFRDRLVDVLDQYVQNPPKVKEQGFWRAAFQRTWHGSPHRGIEGEGFKLVHIGSGEGEGTHNFVVWDESRLTPEAAKIEPMFPRENPPAAFRPDPKEADAYREKLRKTMESLRSVVNPVEMGRTSPVLRALGAKDAPIIITRDVVRKATNGVKHNAPMEAIERLPEELHDPLAVFRSRTHDNALVALTEYKDAGRNPVVVALDLRDTGKGYEVNRIASVYGKDGRNPFAAWSRDGLLAYESERARSSSSLKGLQLPNRLLAKENGPQNAALRGSDISSSDGPSFSRTSPDERSANADFRDTHGPVDESGLKATPAEDFQSGIDLNDAKLVREVGRGSIGHAFAVLDRVNAHTARALKDWRNRLDRMMGEAGGEERTDTAIAGRRRYAT